MDKDKLMHIGLAVNFRADIYVGLRNTATGYVATPDLARAYVEQCCRKHTVCLSVTDTEFIYPSPPPNTSREKGIIVGLINYPRFPRDPQELWQIAMEIAEELMMNLDQCHVSVHITRGDGNDGVAMLSNEVQIALVQKARGTRESDNREF